MAHPYLNSTNKYKVFAHRGFTFREGQSPLDENTIPAFAAALQNGADYLELDVQASADGVAVVFHDANLDRISDQRGSVESRTWRELQRITLINGGSICSIAQVLETFPNAKLNIDIKSSRAIVNLAEEIKKFAAQDRILLTSFSESRRLAAIDACPGVATSPSASLLLRIKLAASLRLGLGRLLKRVNILQIPVSYGPLRLDSPKFIESVKRHGLEVVYWTINDPVEAKRLIRNGAAGIVTDRTDLMIAALG